MKKVAITGLTRMEVWADFKENGELNFGRVLLNGNNLEKLIASQLVKFDDNGDSYHKMNGLFKVSVVLEPVEDVLTVNGQQIPFDIE